MVSTLAGQAGSQGSTNGIGTNARFWNPHGIALDAAGTFAVVVRREGGSGLRDGRRLEEGRVILDGDCKGIYGGLGMHLSRVVSDID